MKRTLAAAVLAACISPATASEISELRGSDVIQRCLADPAGYCKGFTDAAAIVGAANDSTFSCTWSEDNTTTLDDVHQGMLEHFEASIGDGRMAHFVIEEALNAAIGCGRPLNILGAPPGTKRAP